MTPFPGEHDSDSGLGFGGPGSSGDKIARVRGSIADVLSGDVRRRGGIWWDYGRDSSVVSYIHTIQQSASHIDHLISLVSIQLRFYSISLIG